MNPNFRNFALWVVIFLLVLALVTLFQSPSQRTSTNEIPYSQLINEAEAGRVSNVVVAGQEISGSFSDGRSFVTYAPYGDPNLLKTMAQKGVQVIITVDCGIASVAEAEVARQLGIELIITDHHEPQDRLPQASVLVHPRLPTTEVP